jgi:hypothetical protein
MFHLQELLVPSKVKVLGAQAALIDDEHKFSVCV